MKKNIIICNIIVISAFCFLSAGIITFSNNELGGHLAAIELPLPTKVLYTLVPFFVFIPIIWIIIAWFLLKKMKKMPIDRSNELLISFMIWTVAFGMILLTISAYASIMPFITIGNAVQ